jgi:phosphate transport system substrate-binding protein
MQHRRCIGPGAVLLVIAAIAALSLAGCGTTSGLSGKLTLSGSTTVLPIAQEAADEFMKANPDTKVTVQGGGSSVGITQVSQGVVQIGDSSRELKDTEKNLGLVDHKIAYDVIVVIVNPDVKVTNLTADQVKGIFTGTITNWNQVGGPDSTITVVVRDSASGTREMFDEKALGSSSANPVKPASGAIEANSNGVMRQKVASTNGAIGYISYGYLDKSVKPLKYDAVAGNLQTALDKTYPLSRYLHMFTKGEATGLAKSYIDFVLSPTFQNDVVSKDYIPMTKISQ